MSFTSFGVPQGTTTSRTELLKMQYPASLEEKINPFRFASLLLDQKQQLLIYTLVQIGGKGGFQANWYSISPSGWQLLTKMVVEKDLCHTHPQISAPPSLLGDGTLILAGFIAAQKEKEKKKRVLSAVRYMHVTNSN